MIRIKNAVVMLYTHNKTISYVSATMDDQDPETLMALGRGRMYQSLPGMALKYELPGKVTVMLRF